MREEGWKGYITSVVYTVKNILVELLIYFDGTSNLFTEIWSLHTSLVGKVSIIYKAVKISIYISET